MLPFTSEQFFAVFAAYNQAIWPAQLAAYGLAIVAVVLLLRPSSAADGFIGATLAAMWAWTGIAYHWLSFSQINAAAYLFGALFVIEAAALAYATLRRQIRFRVAPGVGAWIGAFLVLYATVLYPLIGLWAGHGYMQSPAFGVTPCPVTIFTFGMLLLAGRRISWWLLAIPLAWSLVGGSAAILLAVPQDWLLLISGVVAVSLIAAHRPGRTGVAESHGAAHQAAWPRPPGAGV